MMTGHSGAELAEKGPPPPPTRPSPGDGQDAAAEGTAPSPAADGRVHAERHHHLRDPRPGAGRPSGGRHERRGGRHLPRQGAQQEVGRRRSVGATAPVPRTARPPPSRPPSPFPSTAVLGPAGASLLRPVSRPGKLKGQNLGGPLPPWAEGSVVMATVRAPWPLRA